MQASQATFALSYPCRFSTSLPCWFLWNSQLFWARHFYEEELEVSEEIETESSEGIELSNEIGSEVEEEPLEEDIETVEETEEVSQVIEPEDLGIEEIHEVPVEESEDTESLEEISEVTETTGETENSAIIDTEIEVFDDLETWNELENELYEEPRQEEVEANESIEAY